MEQAVLRRLTGIPGLDVKLCNPERGPHSPLSPWNFGYYLSQVLPLICLGGSVLSLVLLFQGGAFASAPDPGRPGQAAAIHGPALRGGTDAGPLPPCSALSSHGGGIFVIFAVNMQNYKSVKDKQPGENLIF